ncbi:hypothetical protein KC238_23535 [Mycobacteroides chelonae]|uniref:hypothetical protein n=1 Tax=Mycobacteroides chelonae TaxID=1774 RepID=UPI001C2BAE21|nr:hypothetical protein [Mycobacteroides chelonae]MBV0920233.1 hypothetical protein [Mycobacteroides chelonae]
MDRNQDELQGRTRTARDYRAAARRVAEMSDDELQVWYARAAGHYASLSLWRGRAHQGHTTAESFAQRDDEAAAAAELFLAIEDLLDRELFERHGLGPDEKARRIYLTATVFR